jgi:hypothetical protein
MPSFVVSRLVLNMRNKKYCKIAELFNMANMATAFLAITQCLPAAPTGGSCQLCLPAAPAGGPCRELLPVMPASGPCRGLLSVMPYKIVRLQGFNIFKFSYEFSYQELVAIQQN